MVASANVHLLALTTRKSSIETNLSIDAMRKIQLTHEMTKLSSDYNSKLNQKSVVYYNNGEYNKINYGYLMGYYDAHGGIMGNRSKPVKENMNTILTDYRGQVVLSSDYANAIIAVCGAGVYSGNQGGTFDVNKIPEILYKMFPRSDNNIMSADLYRQGIENYKVSGTSINATTQESEGAVEIDITDSYAKKIDNIVSFYYPILLAAATNGWTTEYNNEIGTNDDYIQDALSSGILCLASVNDYGYYEEGTSLTYYVTSGEFELKSDSDKREEITAWYDAEKERISIKETYIDTEIQDLSTQLEAIKTEIDSIKSFIKDGIDSVFNWGG